MLPLHLINTFLFSNGPFFDRCRILPQPTLALSPSLSQSLLYLVLLPLFRFDIKLTGSRVKKIN